MKARQIRDIGDESWNEIVAEAAKRKMKVGEYLVFGHRLASRAEQQPSKVRPVTPLRERTMFACSATGCGFHTVYERACPRHPQARLKKVA